MREIKFRAWNILTNTMIDLKKITPLALEIDTDGLFIPFSGMPLMQYTGIKDSEGKEIYEGDVVEYYFNKHHGTVSGEVVWVEDDAIFGVIKRFKPGGSCCSHGIDGQRYKIIGNIYENPDLLGLKEG